MEGKRQVLRCCILIDFDLVIRHRNTAALLTLLLRTAFRRPHSQLDDLVAMYTTYRPRDGNLYSVIEGPPVLKSRNSYLPMDASSLNVGMYSVKFPVYTELY